MRVCIVYDCLYPYTVGGAERWYRNLALRLAEEGHSVTYLTLRQWDPGDAPSGPVDVRVVGPRLALYDGERRRIGPPIRFGLGVLLHLLRHGRDYDVVHTASFPYFSLLAAGLARPVRGYTLVVDWHEVWTREYWLDYLGSTRGRVGWRIQRLCVRIPQRAFCFSHLHEQRLRDEGFRGKLSVLRGQYDGPPGRLTAAIAPATVVYAGRHIAEKRVSSLVPAVKKARATIPGLRCRILGDGPARADLLEAIENDGLQDVIEAPGFVAQEQVEVALEGALCLALASRREGYGLVVVEAASHGTPSVVVAGPDNAAVELIEDGINGVVAQTASADDLAAAIVRVDAGGPALRESTFRWFERHHEELSLASSLAAVSDAYEKRALS